MAHPKGTSGQRKYIELTMEFRKEGNIWTGVCRELGTAADGDTFEEVTEALREMVFIHLNTLEDVGECDRFLKEHGVEIYHKEPRRTVTHIRAGNDPNQYYSHQLIPIGAC